jgi:hypothetical protein
VAFHATSLNETDAAALPFSARQNVNDDIAHGAERGEHGPIAQSVNALDCYRKAEIAAYVRIEARVDSRQCDLSFSRIPSDHFADVVETESMTYRSTGTQLGIEIGAGVLLVERAKGLEVAAELAVARAKASEGMALIARQKLRIGKLERQVYGQRSERSARLIEQLALTFEELEAGATEDELAAETAVAKTTTVAGFTRKRPERNTFPDHLPRERVVIDPPTACECCGSARLRKLGEDVTRTLESLPRQRKVIETVREKFTCRDCEKIMQAPAPIHVIARDGRGPASSRSCSKSSVSISL